MTYRQISFLRRKLGLGVNELMRKFPQYKREISVTEWSFRTEREIERLSRRDPGLYREVVACRASLQDED